MFKASTSEFKSQRKLLITWAVTFLIVFPLLILLGYLMRLNQGEQIDIGPNNFYAYMSLHGLGMIGIAYSMAFAGLWYLIGTRYAKLSAKLGFILYFIILIGFLLLGYAAIVGKWGPGWYVLYPLPFVGRTWAQWTNTLAFSSLLVMGVAWLIGILHVLAALAKEYKGFTNTLGWQYFKKKPVERELPPIVMITVIALIPGLFAFLAAGVFLVMYLMQIFEPTLEFDALFMKNVIMYFGHAQANVTLYMCLGWVYCLLPEFTGRPIKTHKLTVFAWNLTFIAIVFAFPHHMYMDFAQPRGLQYLGQIISYISIMPATAYSMFTVANSLYRSNVKWGVVPLMFLFGTMGWIIGICAAVVDATISMNRVLHNTLWVPAHFHTYLVGGVLLFIFGLLFYISNGTEGQKNTRLGKLGFWLYFVGVYIFLAMFYTGGMNSVPRRYASYRNIEAGSVNELGALLASLAAVGITIIFLGLVFMYIAIITGLRRRKYTEVMEAELLPVSD